MCKAVYSVLNSVMEKIKPKEKGQRSPEGEHEEIAEMGNPQPPIEPIEGTPMEEH